MGKSAALVAIVATMWGGVSAADPATTPEAAPATPLLEQTATPFVHMRSDFDFADNAALSNAKVTRTVHETISSHDPARISSGQMAYAALVAADTPAFAAAIERRANKPKKREQFLADLRNNPAMVRELEGSNEAIEAIRQVAARDAARIGQAGERYIADAYRLQETGWARAKLPANGTQRVNQAKAFAMKRDWPAIGNPPRIVSDAGNRQPNLNGAANWSTQWSAITPPRPIDLDTKRQIYLTKTLVLAVRYTLDDLNEGHVSAFGTDKESQRCYNYAQMNLAQCVSASRTAVEEAFCLGTHGLNDMSRCVGWIAGGGTPKG
ncbi:hypothetical protein [Parvularcula marina]|uniref:Uncharacterized protein n=1 Tax=Parvularcula marina TaxID=2292771 RepID=A0A371RKF0_9PROT|nr:hypothetical protein [Parvularcula marina]RFB05917.1 hypothetical protein DX908_11970 [Parvularcula marina]